MNHEIKERLKTVCVYILIIAGILQVGILWSYQNQRTPISLLSGLLFGGEPQLSDETIRESLFIPNRLILSDGDHHHWIVKQDSKYYGVLWDEVYAGLERIASGSSGLTAVKENWEDIIERYGFLADFGYELDAELLGWFIGTGKQIQNMPSFRKLMIKKDIINEDIGVFYILGSDGTVYSTNMIRYDKARKISDIIRMYRDDDQQRYRTYYTLSGGNIKKAEDEPDALFAPSPRYWPYYKYTARPPENAKDEERLAETVLGKSEMGRYNKYTYNGDTVQYTYGSNIYRYYTDGYLTYRYLGNAEVSKNKPGEALMNAYKMIARINGIIDSYADIRLTSMESKAGGVYQFCFDYSVDGMPVRIDYKMKDEAAGTLENAIRIRADSKRVLECDWLIRDFRQGEMGNYNDKLFELLGHENMRFADVTIQEINTGYLINDEQDEVVEPVMMIETKDKDNVYIDLLPQEGE